MHRHSLTSLITALALAACADQSPVAPAPASTASLGRTSGVETPATGVWAKTVVGEIGPGSQYALFLPRNWNGDVVYYAHGIIDAALPVALPTGNDIVAIREALGALGYAVAYSSFPENGWAVKEGVQATHQLRGVFTSYFGKPERSYLLGHSMGGLIMEALAERFPSQYDGTLALCAPLGGGLAEINYLGNVRVLFDYFYPGVLPGNVVNVPEGLDLNTQVLGPAQAAVLANPTGLLTIARITQTPLAGNTVPELLTSLLTALGYNVRGAADLLDRAHGHNLFDNSDVIYTASPLAPLPPALLAQLNANVGRFTATPDALNYIERYYTPTGELSDPTVTLHTTRDPLVPFFHEALFAAAVAEAGSSSLLLQRSVNRYGHCAFTTAEVLSAFQALVSWVETGVRPAS